MLNRRTFFNKLGSFVVGCYLASGLKPLEKILPDNSFEAIQMHQFEFKTFEFLPSFTDFWEEKFNDPIIDNSSVIESAWD